MYSWAFVCHFCELLCKETSKRCPKYMDLKKRKIYQVRTTDNYFYQVFFQVCFHGYTGTIYLDLSFTPLWITPVVIITKTQNVFAKDVTLSLLREIVCNFCTFSKNCSHLSSPIWLKFGIKTDVRVLFMKWILKSSSNVVFA